MNVLVFAVFCGLTYFTERFSFRFFCSVWCIWSIYIDLAYPDPKRTYGFSCCLISRGSNVWLPWIGELGGIPSDCHFNSYLISGTLEISTPKSQWYLIWTSPGAELRFLGFAENLRYQNKCIDAMSNFNKPGKKIAYKYRTLPRQNINSGAWNGSWHGFSQTCNFVKSQVSSFWIPFFWSKASRRSRKAKKGFSCISGFNFMTRNGTCTRVRVHRFSSKCRISAFLLIAKITFSGFLSKA